MTEVKICGITNIEDAVQAIDAGADMLGFNFYPKSPRYISTVDARLIIDIIKGKATTVGIFVNEADPAEVIRKALEAGVDIVQLHGDESPEYCDQLKGTRIIKAVQGSHEFQIDSVRNYRIESIMVDAFHKSIRGGTGKIADWEFAKEIRQRVPRLFLAGGLTPGNVVEAIETVRPDAVDACSGLESAPGKKDHNLVLSFIRRVRAIP